MKANELMIGDWVNYRGTNIQVTSLYDKGGSNEIGWGNRVSTWVNGRCIEPILLTGDILEKNGFKLRGNCTSAWDWDKGEISIQVSGLPDVFSRQTLTIYTSGGCVGAGFSTKRTLSDLQIHYVHQLQHALRLCGINKEIVL